MSFYFVDRIFNLEKFSYAEGIKNVTKNEDYLYSTSKHGRFLNPAIVAEAVMQLTSWLIVYSSDFTLKPVVLRIDQCNFLDLVRPGDQLHLKVNLTPKEENLFLVQAQASVNGKPVLTAHNCHAYAMDINEMNDPEVVKKQFAAIYRPEFKDVSRVLRADSTQIPTELPCKFYAVDKLQKLHSDHKLQALKQYSYAEDFFKDHFPRMPVVPAALQITSLGESAQALASHLNEKAILIPTYIKSGRLRHFITPGSECINTVEFKEPTELVDGQQIDISGKIECNGKKVMQANLGFRCELI